MPELPEVERFRQILLPLVKTTTNPKATTTQNLLTMELYGEKPPRKWVCKEDVDTNNTENLCCTDVLRKGKLLCMVLESSNKFSKGKKTIKKKKYFFLHMGMTGRVVSKTISCSWGHRYVSAEEDGKGKWPPRFTYLLFTSGSETVAFADPRKFGSCHFSDSLDEFFGPLAPDGLTETKTLLQQKTIAASGLANQRLGIKALLLDQKRVVSGVGNWVADEVLYQCELHPDQSYLTDYQTLTIVQTLHSILQTAVDCLNQDIPYPATWLFGFRWTKKKAGKDNKGRNLSFLTSGGRTSAIVASIQKLRMNQGKCKTAAATATNKKKQVDPKGTGVVKVTSSSIIKEEETTNEIHTRNVVAESKKRRRTVRAKQEEISSKRQKQSTRITVPVTPDEVPSLSSRRKQTSKLKTKAIRKKDPQKKRNRKQQEAKEEETAALTQQPNDDDDDNDGNNALLLLHPLVDPSLFRELGFAKWNRNKKWLPIIELGPYHVPPGPIRKEWMKRFEKTNQAPRLVYWYGSTWNDLSNSFSFLNAKAIISYEEGIQQGHDQLSSTIQNKVAAGKQLTAKENALVKGLAELKEESELSKKERLGWLNITEEKG